MQKPPTKADLRKQLNEAVDHYVKAGGTIHKVPRGASGRTADKPGDQPLFASPKTPRTYVNEVVAAIEARRRSKPPLPASKPKGKSPREKWIYDDFGEPIRKVWVEE